MFKKLYNKVIIPLVTFFLPGLTWKRLFQIFLFAIATCAIFYYLVNPRVNNRWWVVLLAGFGAIFMGGLFIRTIARVIKNYLCGRHEVILEGVNYERTKNQKK